MLTRREACERMLQWLAIGGLSYMALGYFRGVGPRSMEVHFPRRPGQGEVIFEKGVFLVGADQSIKALSARCPHLGCRLEYNAEDRLFQCPCHASQFTWEGRRLKGPAKSHMAPLIVQSEKGGETYSVTYPIL